MTLILASASPRRREILTALRVAFDVIVSDADETILAGESPFDYVVRVATLKALDVGRRLGPGGRAQQTRVALDAFVLGADTTVVIDDRALAKPEDDRDGCAMLKALSGRTHEVATGVALVQGGQVIATRLARSEVELRALTDLEIARYVASGEGRDKAGGYAIQGLGGGLVRSIRGGYHNVVGLPAAETIELLREHGAIADWP